MALELAAQELFSIPRDEAAAVIAGLEPRICRGGEWLFRQGDAGDALYLLARGRMQVWIEPEGGGEARMVAEVAHGETVGEIGLLTGTPRSAGIRAVRDSLLLRMDQGSFDRLARERPQLVRGIAGGIATRLRERTAGGAGARHRFRTVALLPLDETSVAEALADRVCSELAGHDTTQVLSAGRLAGLGAPRSPGATSDAVSPEMLDWLAAVEDRHDLVLFVADPGDTAWTRLALRHADLILLVARASADPGPRSWEGALLDAPDAPAAQRALLLLHGGGAARPSGTNRWLEPRRTGFHLHLAVDAPSDHARLARVLSGRSLGLVLGGGAARGFAHLGVYRALHEAGLPVDWFGGASIGAIMAATMVIRGTPEGATALVRDCFVGGKPFGDYTLPLLSLLRGRRMERMLARHAPMDVEDLPLPFFCVSSNLGLGRLQLHRRGPLNRALRATASLPGIFPPAVVDGELTIDGGILDNLPVDTMLQLPVGRVIAVDLTAPRSFKVDYVDAPSPWAVLAGRVLPLVRRRRAPGFMSAMLKATEIGTMQNVAASGRRADLLLRPPVAQFGITDMRPFDRIVEAGYIHAREALAGWSGA
jgi:predicted acylesterase/phospholipase RssA/CRP-like cAMP-binding protein